MTGAPDHQSPSVAMPELESMPGASTYGVSSAREGRRSNEAWVARGGVDDLPNWLAVSLDEDEVVSEERSFDVVVTERDGRLGRVRSAVVSGAAQLDDDAFEDAVARAYAAVLADLDPHRLLRAWNFVPGINDRATSVDAGAWRDRYMVFNAGRFGAFTDVFGRLDWFPVASGVGHAGDAMVIHVLHGDAEVEAIDNPRQVPPESYSRRFGHPTPAFARAGRVRWGHLEGLLVSGTASVVGESSRHAGDVEAQIDETLGNLEVVVDRGWPGATPIDLEDWLVYLPEPGDSDLVRGMVSARWPHAGPRIEFRGQRLCRPELLVEIECAGFRSTGNGGDA